ncbi:MAG: hypothetical protein ABR915_08810 [Thermoguttaceae bacterium]|jgi:hypothetical protein
MTPEIQEMIDELRKEGATYYQVRVVISTINELSAEEKSAILKEFLPPNEAVAPPSAPPSPPATRPLLERIEDWAAEGAKQGRSNYPFLRLTIFNIVKWGLVAYFAYYALWALSRFLNELILKI